MKHATVFSCFILGLPRPFPPHAWEPWSTQTLFHAPFCVFPSFSHATLGNHEKRQNPFSCFIVSFPKPFPPHSWEPWETPKPPSHPTLGSREAPKPLFMLHFSVSKPFPLLGTMKHATLFSCFILGLLRPFPPHAWEPWSTQTLFHASFCAFPSPSHPTLGNHEPLFDASDSSHPTLGNHEKHPPPFSCFIFSFPKPLSLFGTMRNTQIPFHASFLAFPNSSHPTLGNHEKYPPPFSCFMCMDCSWEPWETPKPLFMLHFWPFQTPPTPLFGAMKHPNPFSCFIFRVSMPFPPHSWEPWSTQPLFHASFLAFPNHSHNTLGNHEKHPPPFSCFIFNNYSWEPWETPQPLFMLHFLHSETLPTPLLGAIKHPNPFSCFILAFPSPSHPTLGNHEKHPNPLPIPLLGAVKHPNHFSCFILAFPSPSHSWEPWSTQPCFHASFLAFSDPSHPTLGNHEAPKPFFMLHFASSQALPTPLLGTVNLFLMLQTLPTPLLGTMRNTPLFMFHFQLSQTPPKSEKHPNPFSCFIFSLPKLFPPHCWESWEIPTPAFMLHFYGLFLGTVRNTQTPFHASFLAFPNPSHPTLRSHEAPKPLFMLHF